MSFLHTYIFPRVLKFTQNKLILFQCAEVGEDGRTVQAERCEELGGSVQLDPPGAEGAVEGRHP